MFGSILRDICCGPGFALLTLSIQNEFMVTEDVSPEFRADFFDIANHANFSIPERRRGNSGFGRIRRTLATVSLGATCGRPRWRPH